MLFTGTSTLAEDREPGRGQQSVLSRLPRGGLAGSMKASSLAMASVSEGSSKAPDREARRGEVPGADLDPEAGPSSSEPLLDGRSMSPR